MPRGRSLQDIIERRRRERDAQGERFVDLRLDFELVTEGVTQDRTAPPTIPLSVGGRWDRRASEFDGKASARGVVRFHAGQRRAVEWFAMWLEAHALRRDNPPPFDPEDPGAMEVETDPALVYSTLFAGGRRGGKTWIAVAMAVAYSVRFPGSIVWIVSPSNEKHDEIRRYVKAFAPAQWLDGASAEGWELCNGSRILLKSGFGTGDGLKEGKANFVVLNEGQKMAERAYVVCRGAIVDSSGIVLVCANPPVDAKDQQWVSEFASDAIAHRRASVYLHFNPLLNPFIDRRSLLALRHEVDKRTFEIEVLGMFLAAADAVAYNWVRLENERGRPDPKYDCTAAFMAAIAEGEGIRQVVGLDVQRFPYIGGPIYQFFGDPDPDRVLAWIVGEVVLEGGDEVDFCEQLREQGLLPDETLIVCDASGRYQHSRRRTTDEPPPEWKGRGSFDLIRGEGYTRIVPPDRRRKKNPELVDRARAFTSLISTGAGLRRLFVDTDLAPKCGEAIRKWKTVHGLPSRSQDVAHLGDGVSYPIVRFFPRRLRPDKAKNGRQVDPVAKRVDLWHPEAVAPAVVIMPPTSPARARRGDRFRGL